MSTEGDVISTVNRREASSGCVSYSDPIVLHETSRTRVILVPFFIPRSNGTDLAIKISTYSKTPPPLDWQLVEDKSLSLDGAASRRLLRGLKDHLRVAEENEDGGYILIRVSEGTAQIGENDPAEVASALMNVLSQEEIIEHLSSADLSEELVKGFRSAIHINEMRVAVSQLREYLERGETVESIYQEWCNTHTWAFGNAYVVRDEVRQISVGDELDILLPTVMTGYRDIIELKRPDMNVLLFDTSHRNYYFSSEVSKAIGQSHRYLDILHEAASNGLRDHPEIVAYHPRAKIVIGRSADWEMEKQKALRGLNSRLAGIAVMTYDHLLLQGERLVEMLGAHTEESDYEPVLETYDWDDDGIPF